MLASDRSRRFVGLGAVCVISAVGYALTIDQQGYYSDDFAFRSRILEHGLIGEAVLFFKGWGIFRPLGFLNAFAWYRWLWDWPAVPHAMLILLHVAVCVLLYFLVSELTGDPRAGLAAAAIFAAWHTYTSSVVWLSAGTQLLPAAALLLAALRSYLRHLRSAEPGRRRAGSVASVALFVLSVLFHDQHLGTAALFSGLALLCPGQGTWTRRVIRTWPFWGVSAVAGVAAVMTSSGTGRPLEPGLGHLMTGIGQVAAAFWVTAVWQTLGQFVLGTGAVRSFWSFLADEPERLVPAVAMLLASSVVIWFCLQRPPSLPSSRRGSIHLALTGSLLVFVTLALMASAPRPILASRHTLWPAMGVAMLLAGGFAILRGTWLRRLAAAGVTIIVVGLCISRMGHVYDWTVRTRVTDHVLASLTRIYPDPSPGDRLVLDGVAQYGRGFTCAWGLSSAFRLKQGVAVRIATIVRNENGRLVANRKDEAPWTVDESTRFFLWNKRTERLTTSSLDEYVERHPELARHVAAVSQWGGAP